MTVFTFIASLLGAMTLGMPIAFALMVCGVALMLQMNSFDVQILAQKLVDGADNYLLMSVPFFLLAGEIMNLGGLSRRIVDAAMAIIGHIRGGLGYVAVLTALVLASVSGSAIADTAAVAVLLIPMMRNAGYDVGRSSGLIAAAGIIAPVIPPSIGFVVFGVAAGLSITKLFMAGIVPGLMMGASLIVTWWWLSRRGTVQPAPRRSLPEIGVAVLRSLWALGLPVIIIFGLKFGLFTPTEAGVVAAAYALFVSTVVYRALSLRDLYRALLSAAMTSAIIMFLVAASLVSAWLITVANIPDQIVALAQPFIEHKTLLMLVLMAVVVLVGTALDFTPTILILTPVLMPIIKEAGIDPIYFGVLFIINNAIGMVTPPVGTVLNVVAGVARIRMDDAIRGVMPFMLAQLVVLLLLILFPALVLVPATWFR
ncbi:L-dehydroascorbate transporter large permease subunit [Variovorax paradoxus]|jgi:tripartite ATP-independent transporter DctM subunit|uniref:TRAP transporter large permease subunit n=1 Tax=Variovorax TaxID=34072 RepID=UPI0006E69AA0|nr:L-dehydroascorbate transporter large permease subunit [Variovorax paradoxus]KPV12487.1 L-dehydroascorbate transporter large permease subunit [Variovorax paradoxus]KPV12749.1 L-dehydroascorbate transporter large permease subunit [Variovorax paradoxus]KPV24913.1 L-dehydroascorbate transporter large permease subunit [Variovorax paradoxus]KPV35913.1 L-dehydroascorbate transporter large permease subunit [Variovorax paradoxus]